MCIGVCVYCGRERAPGTDKDVTNGWELLSPLPPLPPLPHTNRIHSILHVYQPRSTLYFHSTLTEQSMVTKPDRSTLSVPGTVSYTGAGQGTAQSCFARWCVSDNGMEELGSRLMDI